MLAESAKDLDHKDDLKALLVQALACADALDLPFVGIKISEAIDALAVPEVENRKRMSH